MKHEPDSIIREKQEKIRLCYGMMAFKSLIPALPFLLLLAFFALMCWVEQTMAPQNWLEDQVRYSRMGEVGYIGGSRFGGRNEGPALMTTDGRAFTCSKEEAALLEEKLRGGDQCSILYVHDVSGYKNLEALSVGGEVLIDPADSERKWQEDMRELGKLALGDAGICVLAAALGYFLWGRKEWPHIRRLEEEIEVRRKKNEARAARRKERMENADRNDRAGH